MELKNSMKKVLIYGAGIALALVVVYVILVATGIISLDSYTEELTTIPNLSGMEFRVVYTSRARLFVTDYAVSVYARRAATEGESLVAKWLNRQTLLFRYDPFGADHPPPSIKAIGNDRILISIPKVSSVLFQSRKYENVTIDYDIGHIDYP